MFKLRLINNITICYTALVSFFLNVIVGNPRLTHYDALNSSPMGQMTEKPRIRELFTSRFKTI